MQVIVKDIIDRLIEHFGVKNQKELSAKINTNYNTLAGWVQRGSIPGDILFEIADKEKISLDWLVLGRGSKYIGGIIDIADDEAKILSSYGRLPQELRKVYQLKMEADAIDWEFKNKN